MTKAKHSALIALGALFVSLFAVAGVDSTGSVENVTYKARQPHIEVELLAEKAQAGSAARVGILFKPDPGWHIYWRNPGDTGLAPVINWQGASVADELNWPYPEYIPIAHLVNLGYHHETLIWSDYSTDDAGSLISAKVDWLVCQESCIPGSANLSLDLANLSGVASEDAAKQFNHWQGRLPQPLELMSAQAKIENGALAITVYADKPMFSGSESVEVFVENLDLIEYGKPLQQRAMHNVLIWKQKLSEFKTSDPQVVNAVVVINQQQAFSLAIPFQKI